MTEGTDEVRVDVRGEEVFYVKGNTKVGPLRTAYDLDDIEIAEGLGTEPKEVLGARLRYIKAFSSVRTSMETEPKTEGSDGLRVKVERKWALAKSLRLHGIEARHFGSWFRLKCNVVGQSDPKNIPRRLTLEAEDSVLDITLTDPDEHRALRCFLFDPGRLAEELNLKSKSLRVKASDERADYVILLARPLLEGEKFEEVTYRTRRLYLVGKPPPREKDAEFLGIVTDDRSGNLLPLVYDYLPLNSRTVNVTEEDHIAFKEAFRPETIEQNIDGTIAPHIVGRALAKEAVALALHSPLRIRFQGRPIVGLLIVMMLGTSTTGKSEIGRSLNEMGILEMATGDLSKSTGLMAAVDTEEKTVIWGAIPMADKEAIFIDSFQRIEPEDLARMREALRTRFVDVVKFVRARAPCRTRIIAAANARLDLDDYVNPCEGLLDCWPLRDSADIARWDLFVPFLQSDVDADDIARAKAKPPKIPEKLFRKHVFWAWSLTEEDIFFSPEAEEAIVKGFLSLSPYRLSSLPLVNNDTKTVLAKIAAAYAILTHHILSSPAEQNERLNRGSGQQGLQLHPSGGSEEEGASLSSCSAFNSVKFGKVEVTEEHAKWAAQFYKSVLKAWNFFGYVDWVMERRRLTEVEVRDIERLFEEDDTAKRIFSEIAKRQGVEAGTLAERFHFSKSWISQVVAKLKNLDLVEGRERRKGYWLTAKGASYARLLLKENMGREPNKGSSSEENPRAPKENTEGSKPFCGQCENFYGSGCPKPNPKLIMPTATYAEDCPRFKSKGG